MRRDLQVLVSTNSRYVGCIRVLLTGGDLGPVPVEQKRALRIATISTLLEVHDRC